MWQVRERGPLANASPRLFSGARVLEHALRACEALGYVRSNLTATFYRMLRQHMWTLSRCLFCLSLASIFFSCSFTGVSLINMRSSYLMHVIYLSNYDPTTHSHSLWRERPDKKGNSFPSIPVSTHSESPVNS